MHRAAKSQNGFCWLGCQFPERARRRDGRWRKKLISATTINFRNCSREKLSSSTQKKRAPCLKTVLVASILFILGFCSLVGNIHWAIIWPRLFLISEQSINIAHHPIFREKGTYTQNFPVHIEDRIMSKFGNFFLTS